MQSLPLRTVLGVVIASAFSFVGCGSFFVSNDVEATGAKIHSTIVIEDVEGFYMTQFAGNSYAVVRADRDEFGHVVEGYNDSLAVVWSHTIPYDRDHQIQPLWLAASPNGVTMVYNRREDDDDTISIHGIILSAKDGSVARTEYLTGVNLGGRHPTFSSTRLVFSPDSSQFVLYRYDYKKLEDDANKTIGVDAELFDIGLNRLGRSHADIAVNDDIDDAKDAEPYVQTFFVANDGHAYQVSYHGKGTMRVAQLDFKTGTSRHLDRDLPGIDFNEDDLQLRGTRGWSGDGEQVVTVASKADDEELRGIALVGMNFATSNVDFVNMVEVNEALSEKLVDDSEMEYFTLRDIVRMPGGEIVVPLEQVEIQVVTSRDRLTGFTSSYTNYIHKDMVMMGFNPKGESIWMAAQRRPKVVTGAWNYRSDALQVDGDSIRYIYRDEDTDGLVAGSISTKTGSMTFPKPLMETSMLAENIYTKWLGRQNALMVLSLRGDYRLVRFSY
jgi:hypothetical protein